MVVKCSAIILACSPAKINQINSQKYLIIRGIFNFNINKNKSKPQMPHSFAT